MFSMDITQMIIKILSGRERYGFIHFPLVESNIYIKKHSRPREICYHILVAGLCIFLTHYIVNTVFYLMIGKILGF